MKKFSLYILVSEKKKVDCPNLLGSGILVSARFVVVIVFPK